MKSLLTPRQEEILFFILKHSRFQPPSVRKIAEHFQIAPSTVQGHIQVLRKKGKLGRS